jgi:hypothetical protein
MTQWDVVAMLVEKWGVPGVVLAGIAWAMWRFGVKPTSGGPMVNETAQAIEHLSAKIDTLKIEVTDRLARVETNVENMKGQRQ